MSRLLSLSYVKLYDSQETVGIPNTNRYNNDLATPCRNAQAQCSIS